MKKLIYSRFIIALGIIVSTAYCALSQTTLTDSIYTGGVYRSYRVYVPAVYNGSNPVPLVFNFHGLNTMNHEQEVYGDFRPIADTANFIIVHPQGIESDGYIGWNNFGSVALASDDINFISALIDKLNAEYSINLNKVYSTGFSNGGFMSYDLACFLSTRFAAIASVSGSMIAAHKSACNPERPVPVMQIHGTSDYVVSYSGSGGIVSSTNIDSLVKFWVNFNNCSATAQVTNMPDISLSDFSTAKHYVYSGGDAGSKVEFYKIASGDHSWPGTIAAGGWSTPNMDFNASKEIWRFFRSYSLSGIATGLELATEKSEFSIYPNPSNGLFTMEVSDYQNASVTVLNTFGEKILEEKAASLKSTLDLRNQPAGMYWCQLKSLEGLKNIKLVVQ